MKQEKIKTDLQLLAESIKKMKEVLNSQSMVDNLYDDSDFAKYMLKSANTVYDSIDYIINNIALPIEIEHIKIVYELGKADMQNGVDISAEEFFNNTYELGK